MSKGTSSRAPGGRSSRAVPLLRMLLGILLLFGAGRAEGAVDVPGAGGIRIGSELIPAEEVWEEYRFQATLRNFIHSRPGDVVDKALLRQVVDQVTNRRILDDEARRLGYSLSPAEQEAITDRLVAEWKGEDNLRTAVLMMKVDVDFLRRRAGSKALREKMAIAEAVDPKSVTREDLHGFYEEHLGDFLATGPMPLRYLFYASSQKNELRETFRTISERANIMRERGEAFEPLIREYSSHPSAARGGVISEAEGQDELPFKPQRLKECRWSNFEIDRDGLHLYFRDCRLPLPFDEVSEEVRERYLGQKRGDYLRALIDRLQKALEIRYLPLEGEIPPPPAGGPSHGAN